LKTIADHMVDVLTERGIKVIGWGDYGFLDECASRCTHTTLMNTHMNARHQRILNAIERSDKFEKHYVNGPTVMRGRRWLRQFKLKSDDYNCTKECETPNCDPGPWCSGFEDDEVRKLSERFAKDTEKGEKVSQKTMQREIGE